MKRTPRFALLVCGFLACSPAFAAPCSGFVDVDDSSVYCANIDWLKNRAITLGCGGPAYCPADPVVRSSMAAFMNRLGVAVTPQLVYSDASGASLDLDAPPAVVCATSAIAAASYPRSARGGGLMTGRFTTAGVLGLRLVVSTDNGSTWSPLNVVSTSAGGANRWVNVSAFAGDVALAPQASYLFGLRADRAGPGTGDVATWNCQIQMMVTSRTGSSVPF